MKKPAVVSPGISIASAVGAGGCYKINADPIPVAPKHTFYPRTAIYGDNAASYRP
jgi:hypothetical protein